MYLIAKRSFYDCCQQTLKSLLYDFKEKKNNKVKMIVN